MTEPRTAAAMRVLSGYACPLTPHVGGAPPARHLAAIEAEAHNAALDAVAAAVDGLPFSRRWTWAAPGAAAHFDDVAVDRAAVLQAITDLRRNPA